MAVAKLPLPAATLAPTAQRDEADYDFTDGAVFPAQPYWVFDGPTEITWSNNHFDPSAARAFDSDESGHEGCIAFHPIWNR